MGHAFKHQQAGTYAHAHTKTLTHKLSQTHLLAITADARLELNNPLALQRLHAFKHNPVKESPPEGALTVQCKREREEGIEGVCEREGGWEEKRKEGRNKK